MGRNNTSTIKDALLLLVSTFACGLFTWINVKVWYFHHGEYIEYFGMTVEIPFWSVIGVIAGIVVFAALIYIDIIWIIDTIKAHKKNPTD